MLDLRHVQVSYLQGLHSFPRLCGHMFQKATLGMCTCVTRRKSLPAPLADQLTPAALFFFFLAELGLHCCTWAFSSCSEWGLLFVAVRGLLIAVASLVAEHRL